MSRALTNIKAKYTWPILAQLEYGVNFYTADFKLLNERYFFCFFLV